MVALLLQLQQLSPAEFAAVVASAFVVEATLLFLSHAQLCLFLLLLRIFCFVVRSACAPVVTAAVAAVAAAVVFVDFSAVDVAVAASPAAATSAAPVTSLHPSSGLTYRVCGPVKVLLSSIPV